MTTDDRARLRHQLVAHEGLRLKPYLCPAGKTTIGVGRNLQDVGISEAEAAMLLEHDIDHCIHDLANTFLWFEPLDPLRQRVWVDLCFNMGIGRLKDFKKAAAAMQAKDYQHAAAELKDSAWYRQVGPHRADWLCRALETGVEPLR
jgi:lysozyme